MAATEEMRAELEDALTHEARAALAGWTAAEAHATASELLEAARPVLEEWQAKRERELVARWHEESGRNGRAAGGWEATLEAASDGRVDLLLYDEGATREAWQCPSCGRATVADGSCPLDGTRMEPREDGLDVAVHQTLAHGGTVWSIRFARELESVEGVAALLRF